MSIIEIVEDDNRQTLGDGTPNSADEIASLKFELYRLRRMMDHCPVGIFHDDGKNHCIYVNDAWCAITGMSREEALGRGWTRIFHPDDLPWLIKRFGVARSGQTQFAEDYRIVQPNGSIRWVHGQSVPILDEKGTLLGYAGTIHDITDRVELRTYLEREVAHRIAELRTADENLRIFGALFEHSLVTIVIADPAGRVTHVNPAYEMLLGSADKAIGQSFVDALLPMDLAAHEQLLAIAGTKDATRCTVTLRGKMGEPIPAQVDMHVIREGAEHVIGIAVMVRDLTDEKHAEAERLALESNLASSREALIRELSTPLMPVSQGVIVMPIVGSISEERAEQIRTTLLHGIQTHDARIAVLDITGVRAIDKEAASAFISVARAAKLLGTRLILSGIGPTVARTIVELGVELEGMTTTSTLSAALSHVFMGKTGAGKTR